jgi:hypothetical protein
MIKTVLTIIAPVGKKGFLRGVTGRLNKQKTVSGGVNNHAIE